MHPQRERGFSAVAEESNAVCIVNNAIAMIPIIEKKASTEIKTFKVTNDYTTRFGYSMNQMGLLLQTKNKLSLLRNNARGGPLQVRVEKNISHGSGGNLLRSRADLRMSMVTEAAKVSSDFVEWQEIKRPRVTANSQMHNTFTQAPFVLNASLPNASDEDEVKLAEWETTLCGIEEHLMTCIFGQLPNVIWATILSLVFKKAEQQLGEYDENDRDKLGCPWKGCASQVLPKGACGISSSKPMHDDNQ